MVWKFGANDYDPLAQTLLLRVPQSLFFILMSTLKIPKRLRTGSVDRIVIKNIDWR